MEEDGLLDEREVPLTLFQQVLDGVAREFRVGKCDGADVGVTVKVEAQLLADSSEFSDS